MHARCVLVRNDARALRHPTRKRRPNAPHKPSEDFDCLPIPGTQTCERGERKMRLLERHHCGLKFKTSR
jgi:hypothetical protein